MSAGNAPLDIQVNGARALRLEAPMSNPDITGAANVIGGSPLNMVSPLYSGVTIAGGGAAGYYGHPAINSVASDFGTIGGGMGNTIESNAQYAVVGGGGGYDLDRGTPLGNHVAAAWGTIGGGGGNRITRNDNTQGIPPATYATISGGLNNVVQGGASTIAGGSFNTIEIGGDESAGNSVIGGGSLNRTVGDVVTIAGGADNVASDGATIAGGGSNRATGYYSFIGGGYLNVASHNYAVVPGGLRNEANGGFSFAAGRQARASHLGAFVWADASGHEPSRLYRFDSITTNEFAVRATGGVRFVTAIDADGTNIAGASLASGSGSWSSLSDRNAKENFAATDPREILDKVAALPLSSWNYKAQGAGVRHLGPTAQDFHAAFGLGESDRTITTIDADGVALAAVQGLNQKLEEQLKEQAAEIRQLQRIVAELRELVNTLAGPDRNTLESPPPRNLEQPTDETMALDLKRPL